MNIKTAIEKYKAAADYFAPDYERDNEVLTEFKKHNPDISHQQSIELVDILNNSKNIEDKYFVADLLYLYDTFDNEVLKALLQVGITHTDPSFNRIFLRPCLIAFGTKNVADLLADKFNKATSEERIGISNLVYWLRPQENGEADKLHEAIIEKAKSTSNLIELYHYKNALFG